MKQFRVFLFGFSILSFLSTFGHAQDRSDPYYQAGNTLYGQKNYDQAIRYYQAALQLNPNKWEADQGMGNCYYAKGDKTNALASYQKALAINPNNPGLASFVQTLQTQVPAPGGANPGVGQPVAANPSQPVVDRNLPKEGHIVLEVGEWDWMGSWTDIQNFYGGGSFTNTPIGIGLGLGAAYVLSPNFQAGVQLQGGLKQPEQVTFTSGRVDTYTENIIGGALEGEGVIPISDGINFIGTLDVGFYTLVGSSIGISTSSGSGTINLSGSGPGGRIAVGIELLMDANKSWALDIMACYQALSFSPVTGTASGSGFTFSGNLINADGSNASLDFSGPGLSLGVRFF